mmetsp:Transcript_6451/g.3666  ORF Transcript_6451/g.3666 Transcript_6451/m.3666 type:complete len:177 (-) Transcript_6451:400-930(-)
MVAYLSQQQQVALDLEHHSFRSFQGFTCLIQLSTRTEDYVVDAIKLRHLVPRINQVTTNPRITKVLHGAESDVLWLQKDFGVYVVNLFDTFLACKALEFPQLSLHYLLQQYCSYAKDKNLQLADWRRRPLTQEMLFYARCDTHYLLYIYDILRKELTDRAILQKLEPHELYRSVVS